MVCFEIWKVFYVDQTAFLENGNITPRAFLVRFEIWKVLNYVGPEFFLEKRIIIPRAIFCVCHGFVASFRSANHFDANTNLAEPHPTDILSNSLLSSQTTVTIVARLVPIPNSKQYFLTAQTDPGYCLWCGQMGITETLLIICVFWIWNLKSVCLDQTAFLEKRSIIPRAKFEIWFSHLKSVYVGQTVFLEKL